MSDTNRVAMRYAPEATAGTLETTAEYVTLPFSGTSDMGATPETVVSDIIRSDRQVNDLIKVNESVGGQFDTELMSNAFDALLEAAVQADSTWSAETAVETSGDNVSVGAGTFTHGTGWENTPAAGDWIEVVQGSTRAYYRVSSATSTVITVEGDPVGTFTTGTNITINIGAAIENGVTSQSFTVERHFDDISVWEYMMGMEVDTFSVSASASSLVSAAFGFVGRAHQSQTAVEGGLTDATAEEDSWGSVYNASSNVATIGEAGTPGLQVCTEITMEVANNLRQRNVLGVVGAASIGSGEFNVSGQLSVYFEDNVMLEKLLNNTATQISFGFDDGNGNTLIFDMPQVKFSEGVPEVSGKNEDVMLNLGYQAYRHPTLDYTLKIIRF